MFSIYNEYGDLMGNYHLNDVVELTESGRYTVVAINHFGESKTFQLIISRFAPEAYFEELVEDKKLELTVSESVDNESHIQTLEIYKSLDNGGILVYNTLRCSFNSNLKGELLWSLILNRCFVEK